MYGRFYRDDLNDILQLDIMIAKWRKDQERLHANKGQIQ